MTRHTDYYGFNLSTDNNVAIEAYDAGARSFVAWRADALGYLDTAIAADPDFLMPVLLKAWIMHAARSSKFNPAVDEILKATLPCLDEATDQERALAASVRIAHNGGIQAGVSILETHLAHNPTDIIAHRLLQFELFWCGESKWMRDVVERAAPVWGETTPGFAHFLAVRAFSNEEAGDYETAEQAGRKSVEIDSESAWGAHAVAHVLVMQGRANEGVKWMEGLSGNWGRANQIGHHNWWHLCLFLLEKGEHERILELLETRVRNPASPLVKAMPDATIDLQNVASLLMRLELRGVDVGERWQTIAGYCTQRISDHDNPFTSAHDAMVLSAVGLFDHVDELVANMREERNVPGVLGNTTRAIGVPLVEAMAAHRKREYNRVVELLWPIRRNLAQVGGSHAQRDIFFQMLVYAAIRAAHSAELGILLEDVTSIGFDGVADRTLYREAYAAIN